MKIDLRPDDLIRLLRLGEREIAELRVQLRRTSTPTYHDDLARERVELERLVNQLRSALEADAESIGNSRN
mgnify:FL=1